MKAWAHTMIKDVLASLTGLASDTAVLQTAVLVANAFSAHVDCLHVSFVDPNADIKMADFGWKSAREVDLIRGVQRRTEELAANAAAAFEGLRDKKKLLVAERPSETVSGPSFAYRQISSACPAETARLARHHDLTVIARDSPNVVYEPGRAGTVLLSSGRPILVPPRRSSKTLGFRVAIAWKDTPEAARAVTLSMPFLARAESVSVLNASEGEYDLEKSGASAAALAENLQWHGIAVKSTMLKFSLTPASERILDEAYKLDTDLLVMGGYGHSRLREFVFGGMTREILAECEIPVLMAN